MSTLGSGRRARSSKAAWLALLAVAAGGLGAAALRGRAGAEGIPATEPLYYSGTLVENGVPVDDRRTVVITLWGSATATDAASKKCETTVPVTPIVKGAFRVP